MQSTPTPNSEENVVNYARNHGMALSMLRGPQTMSNQQKEEPDLTLSLERVLVDRETSETVPYEGEAGIEAFLRTILESHADLSPIMIEDRLMGLKGFARVGDTSEAGLRVTLDAGGQIICTVGPSPKVLDLMEALDAFDRSAHLAARALGKDFELMAEGYNSTVSSPLDIQLVPRTRWTLLTAHVSQTGRYARDVMRCGCATSVSIQHNGDRASLVAYRLATLLAPLLSFLTDNVRSFHGAGARRTPNMMHARMWNEFDPSRCGVVPGALANDFSYDDYLDWLEGTQPILSTDEAGKVVSTGKGNTHELMEGRVLNPDEIALLLQGVYPDARLLEGVLEIAHADAMRPRLVAGYLAFIKGLFCNDLTIDSALSLFGNASDDDVTQAREALFKQGWDATIYGKNAGALTDELLRTARLSLKDVDELNMLESIAELWEVRMVPRDAFVHQEIREARGW